MNLDRIQDSHVPSLARSAGMLQALKVCVLSFYIYFISLPLQETMEKLTWLASERRLCGEGDSEEDNSPNSPNSPTSPTSPISQNSQEENSEDEEDGALKGEELEPGEGEAEAEAEGEAEGEGEGGKLPEEDAPQEDDPPQNSGKAAGRGRGPFSR